MYVELIQHPAVVIPAYQPDEQLLKLIQDLRSQRPDQLIIVVNDGSHHETRILFEQLQNFNVEVLHHSRNFGKGQALKTAFEHYLNLAGKNALGVITADADGQHSVEDILALSDALVSIGHDLHLGVRNFTKAAMKSAKIPWRSRLGNLLTSYIFRKICATPLYDTQTGLRGIPVNLLKSMLKSRLQGYELEMEMLMVAASQQIRINQIPIKTIYFNQNAQSHFSPMRDSIKIYRVIARFLFQLEKRSMPL